MLISTVLLRLCSYFCKAGKHRKPNKIPDCLIPHLLLVLTRQREILVTALILVALFHKPLRLLQDIYAGRCLGFIIGQVSLIK